ncbi:MAG: biotin--[acetyl-CoA-carboxylase] ligase [Thermoanaerobaculia bacterium]|nr:biotin--[acetyl-CoA-carboxylase] ligase [Thermoanaerobaculia bacterium]MCZ7650883.1 biotin--[acetyl-CoA-carboxylase] ligase [Thermoanaerobaculia bacterium]
MARGGERNAGPGAPPPPRARGLAAFAGFPAAAGWPRATDLVAVSAVDSTNSLARRLLERLDREEEPARDFLVLALRQSAGRGRSGRRWESPAGAGLYATRALLLPAAGLAAELPLRIPVALCEALNELLGGRCRIKWPNDLLVDGRKIGGILIEVLRVAGSEMALIGFGLNHSLAAEVRRLPATTSLQDEMGSSLPLPLFSARMVAAVERELGRLGGGSDHLPRFAGLLVHRPGDALHVRVGEETLEGRFAGLDERGFLRLETAGGERWIASGEVLE